MIAKIPGTQLQNYLKFRKDPLEFLYRTHTLGEIVAINPKSKNTSYIIHSREAVKQILTLKEEAFVKGSSSKTLGKTLGNGVLTSEGEVHKRQRKLMQPSFHKRKVAEYADTAVSMTEELLSSYRDGETRSIHEDMMNLTLRIIVQTMFGERLSNETNPVASAVSDIIEKTAQSLLTPFSPPDFLPTAQNRKYKRGVKTLDELADLLIEKGAKNQDSGHLLSLLFQAADEKGEPLTRTELRDQIVTILIAGHETTANVLTWIFAVLAKHPQVEEKMMAEIKDAGQLTFESMKALPYTQQVVQETLRLYPAAWIILREAKTDVEIAGNHFQKGSIFLISPYVMHRNPAFFRDPETFNPGRFSKDSGEEIPLYGFFPFGGGSRGCIGSQFAMMEAVLISATVLRKYKLELSSPYEELQPEPLVSLRIKNGLKMKAVKRS
ncbi:cytochrome P450 [Metabacillus indicus]|uniref:cytochrome P450 n=1 Tax=Metabacillus indicus TaxID=246786 RepID=UPI002A001DB5|nr:cytochrome P450 [Metabacillus indicus]MDX8289787.1 cytochrome P450 [Metabacillus indicus]